MFSHQVTFVLHRWLSMVTGIYQFILLVKAYNPAPVWRDNSGSLCGLSRLSQSVLQSQKECFYSKELWLVVSIMTFIFHNIWDNPSHWLIFFKIVRTTEQNSGNMRWTSMIGATHTHRHTFQIKWLQQWSHIPIGILEMTTHMIIWLNKNKTSNSIYMVLPCITMYYHHFLLEYPYPWPKNVHLPRTRHPWRQRQTERGEALPVSGPPARMLRVSVEWWEL